MLYNEEKKPISVNFVSGSITTFRNLNPNYAIFELDSNGFPQDSSVYITDIAEDNLRYSNKNGSSSSSSPSWRFEYHPKKSYNLADLSPSSWDHFLSEAQNDIDLAYLYSAHYHRHSSEYVAANPMNSTKIARLLQHAKRYSPFSAHFLAESEQSEGQGNDD